MSSPWFTRREQWYVPAMSPVAAWSALADEAAPRGAHGAACPDASLIAATRAGDADAYAELYRRHVDPCRRLARRLCGGSPSATDDVVSEVFANTLRAIRAGRGPVDAFAPYVLRAVRHQVGRTRTRGDGRYAHAVEPAVLEPLVTVDEPDSEDLQVVCDAFRRLPRRFRHVLWLAEVEGRPHAEIGERLGMRAPAVAALVHRARDAFCRTYLEVHTDRSVLDPACRSARDRLASYVRGSLCEGTRRRVDRHLAECPECAAVVDEMRRLDVSLRNVPWVGLVASSPWGALLGRTGALGSELARLAATAAIGAAAIAGPAAAVGPLGERAAQRDAAATAASIEREAPTPGRIEPSVGHQQAATGAVLTAVTPAPGGDAAADGARPAMNGEPATVAPPVAAWIAVGPVTGSIVSDGPLVKANVGDGLVDAGLATDEALVELGIGDGFVDAGLATDEALVELGIGDGLVDASLAAPDTLAHVDIGDGLVDASLAGPDALAQLDIGDGLGDASVATPDTLARVGAADRLVDVTVAGRIDPRSGAIELDQVEAEVDGLDAVAVGPVQVDAAAAVEDPLEPALEPVTRGVGDLLDRVLGG